jgi:hypothetical protein
MSTVYYDGDAEWMLNQDLNQLLHEALVLALLHPSSSLFVFPLRLPSPSSLLNASGDQYHFVSLALAKGSAVHSNVEFEYLLKGSRKRSINSRCAP